MKKLKSFIAVYAAELIFFLLIIGGVLPRVSAFFFAGFLALYILFVPLDTAVLFFIASIPLFIAIPFTKTFDNFNIWRILSVLLFLRWLLKDRLSAFELPILFSHPFQWYRKHSVATIFLILFFLAGFSLLGAPYLFIGFKRIIYFINGALIGIIVWDGVRRHWLSSDHIIRAIIIPTILVTLFGFFQLMSTYFLDVYQFMRIWGENIQLRQFGSQWSYIATHVGNTWLAYYGSQLSLRVFSLFPDSHSFPVFVLLGIPALFAIGLKRLFDIGAVGGLKKMIRTRAYLSILWVPLAFLIIILTGTRGIWAGGISTVFVALIVLWYMRRRHLEKRQRSFFTYLSLYLILFLLLFAIAYPIFVSPQFLLSKGNLALFGNRIKSIIDFGETSNALRIQIWKQTLASIVHHPLLGVGIGNYPIVLNENIQLARAGSSAHNIYLHVAAEMGIPALIFGLWFLWIVYSRIYTNFLVSFDRENIATIYFAAMLLFFPWVFAYLMTDAVLFDERALLFFAIAVGFILGYDHAARHT